MNKYYNEQGEIGLLVSYGFGAGWSSWNDDREFFLMDRTLVEMALNNASAKEVEEYLYKNSDEHFCLLGWPCEVVFLPPNTPFYLHEYDGSEHIVTEFNNTGE